MRLFFLFPKFMGLEHILGKLGILLAGGAIVLGGCGKATKSTGPELPPESYLLEPNAHEIVDNQIQSYNPETGEIIFTTQPNYQAGDVIISGTIPGTPILLRRIEQIQGNEAQTAPATFNDAIESCDLQGSFSLTPSDSKYTGKNGFNFDVSADNLILLDEDGNHSTTDDQIRLDGEINFNIDITDFSLEADISGLQQFTFNTFTSENLSLTLDARVPLPTVDQKIKICPDIYCTPIAIGPLVLVPKIGLYVGVNGNISIEYVGITQQADFEAGTNYTNEVWTNNSSLSASFNFETPSFTGESDVKVSLGPQVELLAYDLVGAYVGANGFLRGNVTPTQDPRWTLYGGLEAMLGAKLQTFGWTIADYSTEIISHEEVLAQAETNPENQPPETEITGHMINGTSIAFTYSGTDTDGEVTQYRHRLDRGNWSETQSTSTTLNDLLAGEHEIEVSAQDNEGAWDPTPARLTFDIEESQENWGEVVFATDNDNDGNYEIDSMDLDGNNRTTLVDNPFSNTQPTFTPDGQEVVFSSDIAGDFQIYKQSKGETEPTKVTDSGGKCCNPEVSPNGERITYDYSWKAGINYPWWYGIQTIDINGTEEPTSLTGSYNYFRRNPSWFPNGEAIVFDMYNREVRVINLTEGTNNPVTDGIEPDISPNGERIVFSLDDEIYTSNIDGTDKTRLTYNEVPDRQPAWSPDGEHIMYTSFTRDYKGDIWIIGEDGSYPTNITETPLIDEQHPVWNPNPNK